MSGMLARLIGVSDKTIQNWENGTSTPKAIHLKKLIEAYLRNSTFTSGKEQAEAGRLWQEAALNEEWFLGLQNPQDTQQPAKDVSIERVTAQDVISETKANAYQPIQSVFLFNEPLTPIRCPLGEPLLPTHKPIQLFDRKVFFVYTLCRK